MIETSRRSLIVGLGALIAAPAIVRSSSLMKIKPSLEQRIVTAVTAAIDGRIGQWYWVAPADRPQLHYVMTDGKVFTMYGDGRIKCETIDELFAGEAKGVVL